jgi:hypothetical protein
MRTTRRTRIIGGIAAGASATAVVGGLVLGSPSGASEMSFHHLLKPESVDNTPLAALVEGEQQLVGAAGAGSYIVQRVGDHLTIVSASPAAGWTVDVKWNDSDTVKAVFSDTLTKVVAVAKLGDDQLIDVAAIAEAIPQPVAAPAVAKVSGDGVKSQAFGADDEHDGWCDGDKDGDGGDFEGAGFRGDDDGDRDGRHHRGGDDWDRDDR